jgi:hypothetical protein
MINPDFCDFLAHQLSFVFAHTENEATKGF